MLKIEAFSTHNSITWSSLQDRDVSMAHTGLVTLVASETGNTDIATLLAKQGLSIRADCGGRGLCGKCRVRVHSGAHVSAPNDSEIELLSASDLEAGYRLACQTRVTGEVAVSLCEDTQEPREAPAKTGAQGTFPVDPIVKRVQITPTSMTGRDGKDLASHVGKSVGNPEIAGITDPLILADLSRSWPTARTLTLVTHRDKGIIRIISEDEPNSLGLAVDLGTTTIAAYLCDLKEGTILASSGCGNPQRRHGEDVISRINYASEHGEALFTLKTMVTDDINRLARECLEKVGGGRWDIDEVVVVGNTTMQHLFCRMHPYSLGRSPYQPVTVSATEWRAVDLELDVHPYANVLVFPVISGFVGGDAVAAVISQDLDLARDTCLLVDIGTNGEVVLSKSGELWATSCATGPALEGAHISCGMRAVSGAIERFFIDPCSLNVTYDVLGGTNGVRPSGMCGSGIIDAAAEMRRTGIILPNGRLNESLPGVTCDSRGLGRAFTLVEKSATANGRPIDLTLQDIRQIQLAKAALAVGIELLMEVAGVERVDRLILTGAFGARFDWRHAAAIGMLPPGCITGTVETVGNAAGLGAVRALLDRRYRERAMRVSQEARLLELAQHPQFQAQFMAALEFPIS